MFEALPHCQRFCSSTQKGVSDHVHRRFLTVQLCGAKGADIQISRKKGLKLHIFHFSIFSLQHRSGCEDLVAIEAKHTHTCKLLFDAASKPLPAVRAEVDGKE